MTSEPRPAWIPANNDVLMGLVDGYMSAATHVSLNQHGIQATTLTELDVAVWLQLLRDYWRETPNCFWWDAEGEETVWDVEQLIATSGGRVADYVSWRVGAWGSE